jgi:hypothetical protein
MTPTVDGGQDRYSGRPETPSGAGRCIATLQTPCLRIMRLFRKSDEKMALEAAAQAEIERLKVLSPEQLAVIVLPGLGPEEVPPGRHLRVQQLCEYLLRDFPGIGQTRPLQLMAPVRRALEKLEGADLVSSMSIIERSPMWRITDRGVSALAEGTTANHLVVPS